ncbi:MAG: GerMN domain-containing protein [Clostridia bacterium]|nr:GerMN domain-containing protein [Clostridia bacterium]
MKRRRMLALLLAALMLSGCAAPAVMPEEFPPADTTAAPASPYEAPIGDAGLSYEAQAALCLPSRDGQRLLTLYETLTFSYSQPPAETILRALLAHEGTARAQRLGGSVPLSLVGRDPVEVSCGVATINLSPNALLLTPQELHTVCQAITATLCQLEDVSYVNVLTAGYAPAMDASGCLPLGTLTAQPGDDLPVLWEQLSARRAPEGEKPAATALTAEATLYFPLADGSGIVPEVRRISFIGQHPQQLCLALLDALSGGADVLEGVSDLPDLTALMAAAPVVTALEDGGVSMTLYFSADLRSWMEAAGADPACTFAAIVHTLTTFVPGLRQVCMLTGDRAVTSVVNTAQGSRLFPGGLHTRADYSGYLLARASVFHPDDGLLAPYAIALPYRSVRSPRALLLALAALEDDLAVLPARLTDADVLGLRVSGDTLLVNLSARYADVIRQSGMDQRLMAYAIVNTLCRGLDVRRVRFFFGSEELTTLGGSLVWSGEFFYNPGLIRR